ncbi:MAG: ABC transporter permease [Propionibacteriaceae bacterium]
MSDKTMKELGVDVSLAAEATEMREPREARNARLSTATLIMVCGIAMIFAALTAKGNARFALTDAFAVKKLPEIVLPGTATVLICALLALASAAGFFSGKLRGSSKALVATVAGISVALGFMAWAASGRSLAFQVSEQLAGTLTVATPLIFGALCGVMCERSGVVNVAIEGQMLMSAFSGAVVASVTSSLIAGVIAAMVTGVLSAALLALFTIKYYVDQTVFGVVLNLFAAGLTGFLFDQLIKSDAAHLNNAPVFTKIAVPGLSAIPVIGPFLFNQTVLVYLAFFSVALVWFVLYRTKWGLRIRAVGEHPKAADTVGISVAGIRWSSVLFGGLFAGLGGSFFTLQVTGSFAKEITVGYGFIALAALIMGRWHPVWAALMAVFFGFVTQLGSQLQTLNTPVPSEFMKMLPYIATIIAVAGLVGRVKAPAADGQPYVK